MRILIFGDSNSWGALADGTGLRHPRRWPVVLSEHLHQKVEIIEDCLPGRTTAHDDPEMGGATFNGLRQIEASLLAHAPLNLVLIMLGTNDMKARFDPSAAKIASNLARLVSAIASSGAGPGPWRETDPPMAGVIVPPPLPENADDPDWERVAEWVGGRDASLGLSEAVADACRDVPKFNAAPFACGSHRDPIHFEPDSHEALGRAVGQWVSETFSVPRP